MDKVALLLSAWLRTLLDKTAATIALALKLTSATTAVCERERDESTIITTRLVKYRGVLKLRGADSWHRGFIGTSARRSQTLARRSNVPA